MKWTELQTPEGVAYVDCSAINAIGPSMSDTLGGVTRQMRLLYMRGGQGIAILDTVENMHAIFDVKGRPS